MSILNALVEIEGLLPPSEATYVCHEIVHVLNSIRMCGPVADNNLYSFERANLHLKRCVKNISAPLASICRNYIRNESSFLRTYSSLDNMQGLANSLKYCPPVETNDAFLDNSCAGNIFKDLLVDVDEITGESVLHYVPASPITCLKGYAKDGDITGQDFENLMELAGIIASPGCLLDHLHTEWAIDRTSNPRRRNKPTFSSWLARYAGDEIYRQ